jgi:hypothetical protein
MRLLWGNMKVGPKTHKNKKLKAILNLANCLGGKGTNNIDTHGLVS